MPIGYVDPGTYITEIYKPKATITPGVGLGLVIIGEGKKTKLISNERVIRGKVYKELLTVSESSPHTATLSKNSDQKKANATLYRNGVKLPDDAYFFSNVNEITINDFYYISGATYEFDYVQIEDFIDNLNHTVLNFKKVGLFVDSSNYIENVDFRLNTGSIDWSILTGASFTGLNTEPFDCSVKKNIKISLDGKPPLIVDVSGADPSQTTASEVASKINNALNSDPNYGSVYGSVASAVGGKVRLNAPNFDPYSGLNSFIILYGGTSIPNSALNVIFGLGESSDIAYEYRGTGKRPVAGQTYYVTYEIVRPDEDYNVCRTFYSDTDFYNDIGKPEVGVDLTIAGLLAWSRGITELSVIQVKDSDNDGIYTDADYIQALDALIDVRRVTEIVILRSSSLIRAKVKDIMNQECSLTKSNYKGYWCGVPRDTIIGDIETPDSLVYIARKEFEVSPDSVLRGRFVVVAPPNYTFSFVDLNGETQTVELDSNYAAVVLASTVVAFERASDSLFRRSFSGLIAEENYSDSERRYLSQNGITVLVQQGGSLVVFDALTTDASGDARYEEPSARTQKDLLAFKIISAVNNTLLGIVPDSPIQFVGEIKSVVGGVILGAIENGDIGYYLDEDGNIRDIDFSKDIIAYRDSLDPRKYRFKYWFQLKVPAKLFFGEFTVDVPFYSE